MLASRDTLSVASGRYHQRGVGPVAKPINERASEHHKNSVEHETPRGGACGMEAA
jgi:hypothetical protein